jgi:hypothetical protein
MLGPLMVLVLVVLADGFDCRNNIAGCCFI